jgi:spore germination protein GerM
MKNKIQFRSSTTAIILGSLSALLLAGGGAAWLAYYTLSNTLSRPTISETPLKPGPIPVQEVLRPSTQDAALETPQIYWLNPNSDRLSFQAQPLLNAKSAKSIDKQGALTQAIQQLLAAAATQPAKTTLPPNTKLLSLTFKNDGIHLNLSQAFTEGGGSDAMVGRLGQILYTVTSLDPDANVWINVNGQPLALLGGEGIEVPQPITRRYFHDNFEG